MSDQKLVVDETGAHYVDLTTEDIAQRKADEAAVALAATRLPDLAPYQFRAMLTLSGKDAALSSFIAALPDPQKTIAQAKLDYSLSFQRDNDLVMQAQQALALTDEQLDALWTQAAAIT